jgi:co-chaperonin GroES (HSP10)
MIATTVAGGISLSAQAATTPTAATVIAAATKSLAKETGVHIAVATDDNKVLSTVVADIGKSSGYETYKKGGETFTISVTPTYAYLSGSKTGLTTLMGLTAKEATTVGSKSIAIKKGSSQYTTFKTNLTSAAFSQLLPAVKGTTLLAKRDKTTGGYQLTWTTAASSTSPKTTSILVVSSSGSATVPLKESVSTSSGKSSTTFTKWDKSFTVKVPTSTIAYTKVF